MQVSTGVAFGYYFNGNFHQKTVSELYDPDTKQRYSPGEVKTQLEHLIQLKRQFVASSKGQKKKRYTDWSDFSVSSPVLSRLDRIYKPLPTSLIVEKPNGKGEYEYHR